MEKIKELKIISKNKVYVDYDEIRDVLIDNGYGWFLEMETESIRLEIYNNVLVVNAGIIYAGTFIFGVIRDVDFRSGIFESGIVYGGIFKHIKFLNCKILGGHFIKCKFYDGIIESAVLDKCDVSKTVKIIEKDVDKSDDDIELKPLKIQENIIITNFNTFKLFL